MTAPQQATMTIAETAAVLGISASTIERAVRRGELTAIRIGKRIQIPRHIVERLLADGNTRAAS